MEEAIARFRTRMAAASRSFLAARVDEQRGEPTTEAEKVSAMSRFWFNGDDNHREWERITPQYEKESASTEQKEQWRREAAVKTLHDVLALPHVHMDGTEPPLSESFRSTFLNALEDAINVYANDEMLENDDRVELPEELGQFLAVTTGVYDVDFRHSGICNFLPLEFLREGSDEELYDRLSGFQVDPERWEEEGVLLLDNKLEVAAGFLTHQSGWWPDDVPDPECNKWFSMLAYCRPVPGLDDVVDEFEYEPWEWRILFYCRTGDIEYDLFSFKTFAEFLDWFSSWDERLDEATMRRATGGIRREGDEQYHPPSGDGLIVS